MTLVRWNPWGNLPTLQDRINRVFDEAFPAGSQGGEDMGLMEWRPVVDTYEQDDAVVIKAEIPGVKKEDVSIDVRNNILTLSGERNHEENVKEDRYYRRERFYGKFQRSFTLPESIDAEKIDAHFKDGVLEIKVPKTEESRAKHIEIK